MGENDPNLAFCGVSDISDYTIRKYYVQDFLCGPHCTNSLSGPRRPKTSINKYACFHKQ